MTGGWTAYLRLDPDSSTFPRAPPSPACPSHPPCADRNHSGATLFGPRLQNDHFRRSIRRQDGCPTASDVMSGSPIVDHNVATHQARGQAILPLPDEVVAQIKSSAAIVSLAGVVLELVKNSLDAAATKIEVSVDFTRGGCSVEDNGLGISPFEFRDEGGLGKLYCMSAYPNRHANANMIRYLQVQCSRNSLWPPWHLSRLPRCHVPSDDHVQTPRTSFSQLNDATPFDVGKATSTSSARPPDTLQTRDTSNGSKSIRQPASAGEASI